MSYAALGSERHCCGEEALCGVMDAEGQVESVPKEETG